MNTAYYKLVNFLVLFLLLPWISGCGGGGAGIAGLLGSLFGGGGGSGGSGLAGFISDGSGVTTLARLHNPEPCTMLLMGSGLIAMAFANKKKDKTNKLNKF